MKLYATMSHCGGPTEEFWMIPTWLLEFDYEEKENNGDLQ